LVNGQQILDQSIAVYNELNVKLDSDLFVVEAGANEVYVYMDHIDGSILSIEYGDQEKTYRELLKLEPAFKDVSSEFLNAGALGQYEFACILQEDNTFKVFTNNNSFKFIASKKDFAAISHPVGNISDAWYLRLDNITTNSI